MANTDKKPREKKVRARSITVTKNPGVNAGYLASVGIGKQIALTIPLANVDLVREFLWTNVSTIPGAVVVNFQQG